MVNNLKTTCLPFQVLLVRIAEGPAGFPDGILVLVAVVTEKVALHDVFLLRFATN